MRNRRWYVAHLGSRVYSSRLTAMLRILEADRLHGTMYRVSNPEVENLALELKDDFEIPVKPR